MEIPGISSFSSQPTVTNPPSQQSALEGRETQAQSSGETQSTVTVSEQTSSDLDTTTVVDQTNEADQAGFNPNNPGGSIDLTA